MKEIRKHREKIYVTTLSYLNDISNLFMKPVKYDIGIWTKDDFETPFKNKNCIILKVYWD